MQLKKSHLYWEVIAGQMKKTTIFGGAGNGLSVR